MASSSSFLAINPTCWRSQTRSLQSAEVRDRRTLPTAKATQLKGQGVRPCPMGGFAGS